MIYNILKQLWQKNLVLKCLILVCVPLIMLSYYLHTSGAPIVQQRIAIYVLFLLIFSCFDSYGFGLTQDRDDEYSELRITYRIIQDIFEVVMLYGAFFAGGGWLGVFACLAGHWFTACDKLFYILRREPDYPGVYTWLEGWSVFFILKYIGIRPRTTATFNLWALIGTALGFVICFL